jgi:tetratricopeptide (TPR) repeat protein
LKNLGDAYYFGSNYEKAVFYYEKVVKLTPHFDEAYYNMAVCLYLQNNFHNAHQALVKALDTAPRNPDYLELKKNVDMKIAQPTNF